MPDAPDRDTSKELPDLEEKFSPGELTAQDGQNPYGLKNERIPKDKQEIFRKLCQKVAQRDMFARIEEVKKAAERRFYWRGMMDVCWNEKNSIWEQPYNGQLRDSKDTGDVELHYPFNIFQAFGREHISIVAEPWNVRMEAKKVRNPAAQKVASEADALREDVESRQDLDRLRKDAARLAWTDGRTGFYTRWVTDGARFGYHDEAHDDETQEGLGEGGDPPKKQPRKPKGGALITPYGVLEHKCPINMRDQPDFDFQQLSFEISLTSAKAMYPHLAKALKGGAPGPGEVNFDRTTRIACTQGIQLLMESGDTTADLPTWQRTWLRPSFFVEIENDADRSWFEDNYPDGAMVAFVGDTYAESRNESMDDHWKINHPLPGDGQNTPACGEIIMPVQDAVCDMTDLKMERAMKSIPAVYCDKNVVSLQAISKETAGPGAHYAAEKPEGFPMKDGFFEETVPQAPQDEGAFFEFLFSGCPQFLTGLYPAAMGQTDEANQTARGIKMLQDASKGQAGGAWNVFRAGYAGSIEQAVRIEAYFRAAEAKDGILSLPTSSGENIDVDLEDIRDGNWACVPEGDQSYPNTHSERKAAFKEYALIVGQTPQGQAMLMLPENQILSRDLMGIQDFEDPQADACEKTLEIIKQLIEDGTPIPNMETRQNYTMQVAAAQLTGKPAPPEPPIEAQYNPSIPVDPDYDDHDTAFSTVKNFINSRSGRRLQKDDPDAYLNVRLYGLAQKAASDKDKAAAVQQQIAQLSATEQAKQAAKPAKTPAESINFKDLGPSGQLQVGKQAGLDLHADVAADLAGEAMGEGQETSQDAKPKGKPQKSASARTQ